MTENGETVLRENTKRIAFLRFLDLPRHTTQPLELALYLVDKDAGDRACLERHGWRVRHSREVADTPEAYRSYVRQSRGEFSSYFNAEQIVAGILDETLGTPRGCDG